MPDAKPLSHLLQAKRFTSAVRKGDCASGRSALPAYAVLVVRGGVTETRQTRPTRSAFIRYFRYSVWCPGKVPDLPLMRKHSYEIRASSVEEALVNGTEEDLRAYLLGR